MAQKGDVNVLDELVRKHMPLVQSLSKRFSWQEDAFQAGCMGLVKAIRQFDIEKGVQFSTYAVPVILGEMRKAAFGQMHWRSKSMLKRVRLEEENFIQNHLREPTVGELSRLTNCAPEEMMFLLEHGKRKTMEEDESDILSVPDPRGNIWMDQWMMRDMIERLPGEEKQLLRLRYQEEKNQKEAARLMATSQSRVSRMEKRVCTQLRNCWLESD